MVDSATFDFHGLCCLRINGLTRFSLTDLNAKYDFFRSTTSVPADIQVDIGPFKPDLTGTTHVDHQYYLRRNYLYFRESLPGLDFEVEVRGLEAGPTEIKFHTVSKNPFSAVNLLYRDLPLHTHVLQPILEMKLGRKGFFLLHGAAFVKNGKTTILVGRGLSFKTTYAFNMVREGYEFMGDDLILFDRNRIHAFPIHLRYFEFYLDMRLDSETEMRGWNNLRMVAHLIKKTPSKLAIPGPQRPESMIVIHPRCGFGAPVVSTLPSRVALRKAWINTRMERSPDRPDKYIIGNFLNAYALAFPDNINTDHWERGFLALQQLCQDVSFKLLETDANWRPDNLIAMKSILEGPELRH